MRSSIFSKEINDNKTKMNKEEETQTEQKREETREKTNINEKIPVYAPAQS